MQEALEARLDQLRAELRVGKEQLAELEARELALRETLLRIDGAIAVLQEMTADAAAAPNGAPDTDGAKEAVEPVR